MYDALGIQGAAGLTAGLGTVLSATPFILFIYGARLRARSPFAQELARREEADRIEREQWRARAQGKESAATSPERSEAEKERAPEQAV